MTYSVTKSCTFEAAHMLANHSGLCRNLHGHSYLVEATATGEVDFDNGMVVDLGELGDKLEAICANLDHAFLYSAHSKIEQDLAAWCGERGLKHWRLPRPATAENLATYIKYRLPAYVTSVKVWETRTGSATCTE